MTTISIELVPRDLKTLEEEMQLIRENFPSINTINIPDLIKFDVRSWEGCRLALRYFNNTIPHIRAIDFESDRAFPLTDYIRKCGFGSVLVIKGDKPQDMSRKVFRTSSIEMIRLIKKEMPEVKVYAGIDPYRSSIRDELEYCKAKREAGAEGFFTQPFFDLRIMEVYADLLSGIEVFWGVSPVMSEKSRNYWENRNNAVFPKNFKPTLEWNRDFAHQALEFVKSRQTNIYFMPIRIDVKRYLSGIL